MQIEKSQEFIYFLIKNKTPSMYFFHEKDKEN